ncbi:hypothetical protein Aph02nite_48640 [Actinoplanes philippinensis]|nr:hypothetical protein Aph02nite_48640 [Actinoplanes philippinensis]
MQALPHLAWGWRFAILAIPFLAGSATGGSTMRLLHDIVPAGGFVLGRATLNIATGVMQIAGYGLGGLLLAGFATPALFLIAAAASATAVLILRFGIGERPGVTAGKGVVERTREVNRTLLGSPVTRPLYLAMWVPNGLVVGCEALYVPYAGRSGAGYLFAAGAAGMLLGDVVVGRFVAPRRRDRMIGPLRLLLALPYLGFWLFPPFGVAVALAFVAAAGFAASLPLTERLATTIGPDIRGQAFGLYSTGLMLGQAIGAVIGGALATGLGAARAMGVLAVVSLAVTLALNPGLRRSGPAAAPVTAGPPAPAPR